MRRGFQEWGIRFINLLPGLRIRKRLLSYNEVNAFFINMKKRRKLKDKLVQITYNSGKLQKNAVELKKSIDIVSDFLEKGAKKRK